MKRKIIIPILTAVAVLLATAVVILILQTRNADPTKKDNRPGVTEDQSAPDSASDPKEEGTKNQDAAQAGTGGVSSPDVPQDAGELPVYSDNTQGQPAQGGTATTQQPAEEQTPEETTVYTDPEQSGDEYQLPIIFD